MINADELLARLQIEIEPRLDLWKYQKLGDTGTYGYDCCGCSTPSQVYDDIVSLISRLRNSSDIGLKTY